MVGRLIAAGHDVVVSSRAPAALPADWHTVREHARPVLAAIGDPERLRHCGPVGSGLVMKLLNDYLVAVNAAAATGEALALAREAGVDVRTAIEAVVSGGGGANAHAQLANLYPHRVLAGDFEGGFKLGHMVKDLRHAYDLAAELGVESPLGRAAGTPHGRSRRTGTEPRSTSAPCPASAAGSARRRLRPPL